MALGTRLGLIVAGLALATSALAFPPDGSESALVSELLLQYQAQERFRDRARQGVLHLSAQAAPREGFDPSFGPRYVGAATLLPADGSRLFALAATELVDGSRDIVVSRSAQQYSRARFVKAFEKTGMSLIEIAKPASLGSLKPLPFAREASPLKEGRTVFAIGNLGSGMETVLWGEVGPPGEEPREHLRVVAVELRNGHPLLNARGEIIAFCVEPVSPTLIKCMALPAAPVAKLAAPKAVPTSPTARP